MDSEVAMHLNVLRTCQSECQLCLSVAFALGDAKRKSQGCRAWQTSRSTAREQRKVQLDRTAQCSHSQADRFKELVANPERNSEKPRLRKNNLWGKNVFPNVRLRFSMRPPRLEEVAALPQTDIVRDAAIQRFEFTFELVWKTLQLYLEHEGLESGGPRAVLKRAFLIRLISDQDEADVWMQMLDDRNLTSHAYDETLAVRIYTRIVHDYAPRLARMAERIQTLVWD